MEEDAQQQLRAAMQTKSRAILLKLLSLTGDAGLGLTDQGARRLLTLSMRRLPFLTQGKHVDELRSQKQLTLIVELQKSSPYIATTLPDVETCAGQVRSNDSANYADKKYWSSADNESFLAAVRKTKRTADLWRKLARRFERTPRAIRDHYRALRDAQFSRDGFLHKGRKELHKKGVVKDMMLKAIAQLGGTSTTAELVRICLENEAIKQEFGQRRSNKLTKVSGTLKESPAWEAAVCFNMGKVFSPTGAQPDGRKVYSLK